MEAHDLEIQCLRKHLAEAQRHLAKAAELFGRLEAKSGGGKVSAVPAKAAKETKKEKVERYAFLLGSGQRPGKPEHLKKNARTN